MPQLRLNTLFMCTYVRKFPTGLQKRENPLNKQGRTPFQNTIIAKLFLTVEFQINENEALRFNKGVETDCFF